MFITIESAFMIPRTACSCSRRLGRSNVLLVSPSMLLFVLRKVAYLWRQEDQNRNAQAIADRGASLYDKLCDFLKDLEPVGSRLEQAQAADGEALKKLQTGRGNLVSQAQKLTSLTAKASRKTAGPLQLTDNETPETEVAEGLAALAANNTPREPGLHPVVLTCA